MNVPKRHHFVPIMLQKRFLNADGKLFILDKRRSKKGIYSVSPINAFVQNDLNTIVSKDGTKDTRLESWYSELEGTISPIIDKIVTSIRRRQKPSLTIEEKNAWDNFVYHQQKRAPDVFERLGLVQELRSDITKHLDWFEENVRPLTLEERADLMTNQTIDRIVQTASVTARGRGAPDVIAALANRGLAICLIPNDKKSFIIGDHPQSRMGSGTSLRDPMTELWMPIARDVAVSPSGAPGQEKLVWADTSGIRRINEEIYKQSNIVGSCSEELLRSLARLKKNS